MISLCFLSSRAEEPANFLAAPAPDNLNISYKKTRIPLFI